MIGQLDRHIQIDLKCLSCDNEHVCLHYQLQRIRRSTYYWDSELTSTVYAKSFESSLAIRKSLHAPTVSFGAFKRFVYHWDDRKSTIVNSRSFPEV